MLVVHFCFFYNTPPCLCTTRLIHRHCHPRLRCHLHPLCCLFLSCHRGLSNAAALCCLLCCCRPHSCTTVVVASPSCCCCLMSWPSLLSPCIRPPLLTWSSLPFRHIRRLHSHCNLSSVGAILAISDPPMPPLPLATGCHLLLAIAATLYHCLSTLSVSAIVAITCCLSSAVAHLVSLVCRRFICRAIFCQFFLKFDQILTLILPAERAWFSFALGNKMRKYPLPQFCFDDDLATSCCMCCHTSMRQHPRRWVWVWLAQHLVGMWVSPSSTELHDLPFAHSHLCKLGKGANKSKMGRSLSMLMFEDFMLMTWSRLPHLAIS